MDDACSPDMYDDGGGTLEALVKGKEMLKEKVFGLCCKRNIQ